MFYLAKWQSQDHPEFRNVWNKRVSYLLSWAIYIQTQVIWNNLRKKEKIWPFFFKALSTFSTSMIVFWLGLYAWLGSCECHVFFFSPIYQAHSFYPTSAMSFVFTWHNSFCYHFLIRKSVSIQKETWKSQNITFKLLD